MNKLHSILFALTAVVALSFAHPAQAFTITMDQVGSNVVANGSGAFNLTGLTNNNGRLAPLAANVFPSAGVIQTGPQPQVFLDIFNGFSGPTSFGSGSRTSASLTSGDTVTLDASDNILALPHGYVSGTALSDMMTFNNATFASLGLTPGTYEWTWGTGLANQNFTLVIESAGVPDAGSTLSLLSFASLGLVALRRKLRC
jgi:VPDSG-CTERM motif